MKKYKLLQLKQPIDSFVTGKNFEQPLSPRLFEIQLGILLLLYFFAVEPFRGTGGASIVGALIDT